MSAKWRREEIYKTAAPTSTPLPVFLPSESKVAMSSSLKLISKIVKSKDGTELFAEACGDPTKQAVIFAHGFACAGIHFDDLFTLERMQRELFLVRWDSRAHGRSAKPNTPEAYESARFAEDFDAICKAFNVSSPIFAGWSAGGAIAADVFAYGQTKPKALIMIAGPAFNTEAMHSIFSPLCLKSLGAFLQLEAPGHTTFEALNEFCAGFTAPKLAASVPYTIMTSWIGTATRYPPQCAAMSTQRKQDPAAILKAAAGGLPLCLIHGKEDQMIYADKVAEQMKPHFKDCEVHLLEGIGHIPFWEDPVTVADIIVTFAARPLGAK